MAWKRVSRYSLGFSTQDKQCFFYYELEGGSASHQLFVTADEMCALADMFRNEGPISYNTDGSYFVTAHESVGEGEG